MTEVKQNYIEINLAIIQNTRTATMEAFKIVKAVLKNMNISLKDKPVKLNISNKTSYNVAESTIENFDDVEPLKDITFEEWLKEEIDTRRVKFVSLSIVGKVSEEVLNIFKDNFKFIPLIEADEIMS